MDALLKLDKTDKSLSDLVLGSKKTVSNIEGIANSLRAIDGSVESYGNALAKLEENQTLRIEITNSLRLLKENSDHQLQSLADVEENISTKLDKLRKSFAKQATDLSELREELGM